jgi:hypothetical protein
VSLYGLLILKLFDNSLSTADVTQPSMRCEDEDKNEWKIR